MEGGRAGGKERAGKRDSESEKRGGKARREQRRL